MLTITFLGLLITLTVVSGSSLSDQVHQTPTEMVVAIESGQTVTLSCSHSIQNYNQILWYKQQHNDKQMELLGYMLSTTAYPEKGKAVAMEGSADQDQTARLTIQNIREESSAVYFCAASFHNAACLVFESHKKSPPSVLHGASLSDQVHQTPTEMVVAIESGQTVTLSCSHSIQDYNRILWYKQQHNDKQMEFLGYILSTTANPEKGKAVAMGGSADKDQTARLTIQNIREESSAVYFCAASIHNAADQVHQTPTEMVVSMESGQTVTLSCSHSIQNYERILWYKQQHNNKQMELLGYIYTTSANPEKGKAVAMGGSADKDQTATLTIQNIRVESSAVYFCAASIHNATPSELIRKPGDNAELVCKHEKTDYRVMLWYQQSAGKRELSLIGHVNYKSINVESAFEKDFSISGDLSGETAMNGSLLVHLIDPESSGVYYCAARLARVSLGIVVYQTPSELIRKPGDSAELVCKHEKTDYRVMLWYQQSAGKRELSLIGHVYFQTINVESAFEKDFSISGDLSGETAKNGSLTVRLKDPESSASFFQPGIPTGISQRRSVVGSQGEKVTLTCSHEDEAVFYLLWYRHKRFGEPLVFIGYIYAEIQSSSQIVKKGAKEIQIDCSHDDSSYVLMLWYQRKDDTQSLTLIGFGYESSPPNYEDRFEERFSLTRESVLKGALVIKEAAESDSAVYFCAASLAAVPVPIQSGDLTLRPGADVTLTCDLASDMSSYTMLWYRQLFHGQPIEFLVKEYDTAPGRFRAALETNQNRFTLEISETQVNDSGTYYCAAQHLVLPRTVLFAIKLVHCANYEAYFGQGTKLTVLETGIDITPPKVVVLPPSVKECGGPQKTRKTLVCVASGFYPDHVTVSWYVDDEPVTAGVANDHNALRTTNNSQITSRLSVEAKVWHNPDTKFNCTVSFFDGAQTTYHSDMAYGDPINREPKEQFMKVTQTAKLSYVIFIVKNVVYGLFVIILAWKLGIWRSHATTTPSQSRFDERRAALCSQSEAYFGKGTKLTVLDPGTVITPPKVVVLPPSLKECGGPQKTRKTLVCVASGFYPAHVTVSWYVGNEPVTAGVANDHNALRMMKNSYQITSRLSVEAKVWHNADTMFTCTVSFFNGTQTTYHSDGINGDSTGQIDPDGMTKEQFMKVTQTAKLSYVIFIVKNVVYGLFVIILAWKLGIWRSHATAKM
ncbi:unnamed protein product [Lota lota]